MSSVMVDRLLRQLEQRNLTIRPGAEAGQLVLSGPNAEKTPEVMAALKAFKPQLLERFGASPDLPDTPRGDVVVTDPKGPAPMSAETASGLTRVDPHNCRVCDALVLMVPDEVTTSFCDHAPAASCPYRRGTRNWPGPAAT